MNENITKLLNISFKLKKGKEINQYEYEYKMLNQL